jgi:hypothetical protein
MSRSWLSTVNTTNWWNEITPRGVRDRAVAIALCSSHSALYSSIIVYTTFGVCTDCQGSSLKPMDISQP